MKKNKGGNIIKNIVNKILDNKKEDIKFIGSSKLNLILKK